MKRVLLVAENASTKLGGEAILPYHYMRLLRALGYDAHLIAHERCRADLQELFPDDLNRLHFVRDTELQKLLFRLSRFVPRRVGEATFGLATTLLTEMAQRSILRPLVVEGTVIHQPIPVGPRFPSLLFGLGAPVLMGPLNGGMEYPPAFRGTESVATRTFVIVARKLSDAFNALLPGKRRAAMIMVANERTRLALPSGLQGQVRELVENGVDMAIWDAAREPSSKESRSNRFVFIGRLVDWKALDLVIDAVRQVPEAVLDIIGDGAMRPHWQALAASTGVGDRVNFLGWQTQSECARHLSGCTALVLPSLYECGGAVVLEAMAMARPVIATAWGGPLDYLTDDCGILIPPTSRPALVNGFAEAMQRLISFPGLRDEMGRVGRERLLGKFDWNQKIQSMLGFYESVLTVPPAHPAHVHSEVHESAKVMVP